MNNKAIKSLTLVSIFSLTACIAPQAYFPQLPAQESYGNSPQSQHDKLSKAKADEFITIGETDVTKISFHYGVPNIAMKNDDGNDVWMYQAKSVFADVKLDSGTNVNSRLGSASTASSVQGRTEVSSKSTTLKVTFNAAGIVTSYYSQTTLN